MLFFVLAFQIVVDVILPSLALSGDVRESEEESLHLLDVDCILDPSWDTFSPLFGRTIQSLKRYTVRSTVHMKLGSYRRMLTIIVLYCSRRIKQGSSILSLQYSRVRYLLLDNIRLFRVFGMCTRKKFRLGGMLNPSPKAVWHLDAPKIWPRLFPMSRVFPLEHTVS